MDFKSGNGNADFGEQAKPDCTIQLSEADLLAIADGKFDGGQAFIGGRLKIKGNMLLAQKLAHSFARVKKLLLDSSGVKLQIIQSKADAEGESAEGGGDGFLRDDIHDVLLFVARAAAGLALVWSGLGRLFSRRLMVNIFFSRSAAVRGRTTQKT